MHTDKTNATKELKTWLDKNNIVSTLNTISDFTCCKVDLKPLPTKVLKKVRNKTKDDDNLQVTVNQLMAKIEDLTSDNKSYVDKICYLEKRIATMEVDIK